MKLGLESSSICFKIKKQCFPNKNPDLFFKIEGGEILLVEEDAMKNEEDKEISGFLQWEIFGDKTGTFGLVNTDKNQKDIHSFVVDCVSKSLHPKLPPIKNGAPFCLLEIGLKVGEIVCLHGTFCGDGDNSVKAIIKAKVIKISF